MNQVQLLTPLLEKLEHLSVLIKESHYIPLETRKSLEEEIIKAREKLKEGNLSLSDGEKLCTDLNQKAAHEEIESLIKKIGNLNPSSPRLQPLRELASRLNHGEIGADQVRDMVVKLMTS